ncbi:hypothetical protein MTBUT4_70036 [Magnetospirillum sp. UT-4]|nr:hypothetical protein MTBUT4_70036 [Magnetospirillum sp. UT-4]
MAVHRPRAGALALGLHDPARARVAQGGAQRGLLHASQRRQEAQSAQRRHREDQEPSRRDRHPCRHPRPQPAARGPGVRAVLRRIHPGQQADPGRHLPDFQGDRLQEVRRQGREGVGPCLAAGPLPPRPSLSRKRARKGGARAPRPLAGEGRGERAVAMR